MNLQLSIKDAECILWAHKSYDDNKANFYEIIEYSNWTNNRKDIILNEMPYSDKYEYKDVVFKYIDKFYRLSCSRSGSYFTDWDYDWNEKDGMVECIQVTPVAKTVISYESIE